MFWSQLKKEMSVLRGELLLAIVAFILWAIFLHTRMTVWEPWMPLALAWLPQLFIPIWIVWNGVHLYHHEWNGNTHYLMLSLPVRGWRIWLPKLTALAVGSLLMASVVSGLAMTLAPRAMALSQELRVIFDALPKGWLPSFSLQVALVVLLSSFLLAIIAQFSYLFSRLFERFQWLLMAWTVILTVWAMERFVNFVSPLLGWLPDFRFHLLEMGDHEFILRAVTLDSAPALATALFAALLMLLINVMLEDALEV